MAMRNLVALAALVASARATAALEISSPEIAQGGRLGPAQVKSECGGQNISPALSWRDAPAGTKSFAITMYDPDAKGGWWHWIVYDIPVGVGGLAAGVVPAGAKAGTNDFGAGGYGGACPPSGSGPHRYEITVWALGSARLPIEGAKKGAIIGPYLSAHALAHATLTGTYER
ncbi:MAG TPA: YbhB/YbcL family Raf kinase inhibitor-like protein [Rhizomicrobium sp.]|nr:YbhB/YbcL family Raf kinase inhibitor-like protein [Rhizomicrobium sp.]